MILLLFISVKSIQVISGFNLKKSKKFAKWAAVQKYQKQILEPWYLHYSHSQGCQGRQKIQKTKLKITLVTWSTKIQLKLNKIQKKLQKTGFFWQCLFNFDVFSQFLQFWLNLSAPTDQSRLQFGYQIYWHPWHPLGHVNSGVNKF